MEFFGLPLAGVLRGNTIRGNTTRNSEMRGSLMRGPLKNLWKPLKTSKNLWKPLKTSENLWNPPSQRSSQRPSQRQIFLSEPLSPVAPNRVAPWNSYNPHAPLGFRVGNIDWRGFFLRKGGFSNSRFVLKPDVAIASEVPIFSTHSLAIRDFHAKKTQHAQLFENPLPGTPPFAIPNRGFG